MIVGLTGGLGCGKSRVAERFAAHGIDVVDTDVIARELTSIFGRAIPAIRQAFGESVFNPDGSLNRPHLRSLVLANDASRHALEAILHPMIREEATRRALVASSPYVLMVVPLLVETGAYDALVDRVLVVDCAPETQMRRALGRGGWSEAEIRGMLANQANREARLDRADDVLDNQGSLEEMQARVDDLHRRYLELAVGSPPS